MKLGFILSAFFGLLALMGFGKYYELSSITFVDGDGIGLYLLGRKLMIEC